MATYYSLPSHLATDPLAAERSADALLYAGSPVSAQVCICLYVCVYTYGIHISVHVHTRTHTHTHTHAQVWGYQWQREQFAVDWSGSSDSGNTDGGKGLVPHSSLAAAGATVHTHTHTHAHTRTHTHTHARTHTHTLHTHTHKNEHTHTRAHTNTHRALAFVGRASCAVRAPVCTPCGLHLVARGLSRMSLPPWPRGESGSSYG
jgi:hypothetical protein